MSLAHLVVGVDVQYLYLGSSWHEFGFQFMLSELPIQIFLEKTTSVYLRRYSHLLSKHCVLVSFLPEDNSHIYKRPSYVPANP
jgi:hypothetical protein